VKAGATVGNSVTAKTNIVVAGTDAVGTKKVNEAMSKGVEIWTESDFNSALSAGVAVSRKQSRNVSAASSGGEPAKKRTKNCISAKNNNLGQLDETAKLLLGNKSSTSSILNASDGTVMDILMAKVDIKKNTDKFYIMQLITDGADFYVFTRWGRTGTNGQCQLSDPDTELVAIELFGAKFLEKTGFSSIK